MAATADGVDGLTRMQAGTQVHPGGAAVQGWQRASFLKLAALPAAVPCGRLHTKHVLREWNLARLADDAEMLVSELLTNAVKASSSPQGRGLVVLRLLVGCDRFLIEVWDHDYGDPQPRQVGTESENGRGFTVIEALSRQWGFRRFSPSLKVVWCELAIDS